jgi:hypothetical protein
MNSGMAESEFLTDDTALRRVQGATSYKFRTRLELSREVNANS